jgi:hypothetical protein
MQTDAPGCFVRGGWTPIGHLREEPAMSERDRQHGPSERRGWTPQPNAGQVPTGDIPDPKPPTGGFNNPPTTSQDQPPPASDSDS